MRRRFSRHSLTHDGEIDESPVRPEDGPDTDPEAADTPHFHPVTPSEPVAVWAPAAASGVELVRGEHREPMLAGDDGWWHSSVVLRDAERYGFSLDGGPVRADPRSRRQPEGPHAMSEAYWPGGFAWTDDHWGGTALEGLVLYELHIGTFTPEGTFDAAVSRLDELVELGIDAVSLLPVATFPGRHGWGYDGVCLWSVQESYGGPAALQRFVDACHARHLSVVLDVVYNHLGPDGNYLAEFGPYFTTRYATPWGPALNLDGLGSDTVRDFVIDNALSWIRDFHVDGLRLDAVHELHDDRAVHLLEELATRVDAFEEETGRVVWLIAESDRNDPRTVTSRDAGGLGMDAQWADDVHHGLHVAVTGEQQGYYADFADPGALVTLLANPYFHAGTWSSFRGRTHGRPLAPGAVPGSRFVVSLQTHDQVGNRRLGDRLSASVSSRRLCCAATLLLTCPFTPMLFMGEEWAAGTPWQFFTDHPDADLGEKVRQGRWAEFESHGWDHDSVPDPQDEETFRRSKLDWSERDREPHSTVLGWYKALLALRTARADLRDGDLAAVEVTAIRPDCLRIRRGDHRVAVNLGDSPVLVPLDLPDGVNTVVLLTLDPTVSLEETGDVHLPAESAVVAGPTMPRRD